MNERIRLLAEQAGHRYCPSSNSGPLRVEYLTPEIEKFALLIVQDCLAQVDKVDAMLDDPKEKVGVSWVGLAIAKHWGLE
jgi:hypothetical protein